MDKFNRVYSLEVETATPAVDAIGFRQVNGHVEITLPYTIEFEVSRRSLSSTQTARFRIYNLGKELRGLLLKDAYEKSQFRAIKFRAGYENQTGRHVPLVFNGSVLLAYSFRTGQDWITEIEAFDGGWQMANANSVSLAYPAGKSAAQVIQELSFQMPHLSGQSIIGDFPVTNKRGEALFGNAWDIILLKSNGWATIDNGQLKALNYNEVIEGSIPLLSSETGLLGSPKRTESSLEFDMIFEPRLTVSQIVRVESLTNTQYNRDWKVMGFTHRGTISPAVSGDCITSVILQFTNKELKLIQSRLVQ